MTKFSLKWAALVGLSLCFQAPSLAQNTKKQEQVKASPILKSDKPGNLNCGTLDIPDAQRKAVESEMAFALQIKRARGEAISGITYVPIRPHILRQSDGSGGYSLSSINNIIAITNSYHMQNGSGIQYYFAGTSFDYVDNTTWYTNYTSSIESSVASGHDVSNALNQYYVNHSSEGWGGYAYYPANAQYSTRSFILVGAPETELDLAHRVVPHELGHTFNLIHTFGNNNGSGTTSELVTRGAGANCTIAGDLLCDTPADPYGMSGNSTININGCPTYNGTAVDATGVPFNPSITNLMSYYFPCIHDFTAGQYDRMQGGLALRQSHTAYSLTYPSTNVPVASNLAASFNSSTNTVSLTWQDNASNEMGYFIERSTLPTTGFVPIGGVGPNVTTFADTKAGATTTYYYRVKPSNSSSNISSIISITTPTFTCHPTFSTGCSDNDGLNKLVLNGVTLSDNSGCSPNGYGAFTGTTTVAAGQTYSFTGNLLSTQWTEGVAIWLDANRNGSYEATERVFYTPSYVAGSFSGSITIPNIASGPLPMRVIVSYKNVPDNPCGTYNYGEAEDYSLTVDGGSCTVAISGTTVLSCSQPTLTLTASTTAPSPTYKWSTGATTAALSVTTAGTYSVTMTSGTCKATASKTVTGSGVAPTVAISGTTVLSCSQPTLTLTASTTAPSPTYKWSTGATTAALSVTTAGTYSVTMTSGGCKTTAAKTITGSGVAPTVAISGTTVLSCSQPSLTLTASTTAPAPTYKWSTGATTAALTVTTAGTYSVTMTSGTCKAIASKTVTGSGVAPTVAISGTTVLSCSQP
ncbi:hypothetical protein GO755_38715, partial [Spirosoma sp. HMF4905]